MTYFKKTVLTGAAAAVLTIGTAGAAFAQSTNSRIEALERGMQQMGEELRQLKAEKAERDAQIEKIEKSTADMPIFDPKKLQISSRDGKYSIRFGGRLQVDGTVVDDDDTEIGNGAQVRRARFFAEGKLDQFKYKLQIDFEADNDIDIEDAWISTKVAGATVKVGNQKEPFSLEELTSSKYTTFIERALPNEFAPGRNLGISVSTGGDAFEQGAFGLAAGFFTDGVNNGGSGGTTDWAITGRGFVAPVATKTQVLHAGIGLSYRGLEGGTVSFEDDVEINLAGNLYDTGDLDADSLFQIAAEGAWVWGPVSLQGEYFHVSTGESGGGEEFDFDGAYVEASWFVTGESRNYSKSKGSFGRVKADDAFMLAARWSYIDVSDGSLAAPLDTVGGDVMNYTVGGTYIFNPYIRILANYVHSEIDDSVTGTDQDVDAVIGRFQVDF